MAAELRKDLIVNRWVLISARRGKRPHDYSNSNGSMKFQGVEHPGPCAFCYRHEHETGPELLAFRAEGASPNSSSWRVRVVQNKFPAVSLDLGSSDGDDLCATGKGVHKACSLPGFGSHEVVVETPHHAQLYTALSVDHITEILKAYQCRIESLRSDKRFKYCQIFKNNGSAAGASMVHNHSQIIALPVVPKAVEEEVAGAKAYFEKTSKCVFCDVIERHLSEKNERLIDESKHFVTMAPFAARFPYETWILPRTHRAHFGSATADEVHGLADILKLTLMKVDKAFDYPPYNFMLQTVPLHDPDAAYYHWYIRIVPHLITLAGFELGSGCHINPVAPEAAAEAFRAIQIDENDIPPSSQKLDSKDGQEASSNPDTPARLINMTELCKKEEVPVRLMDITELHKKEEPPARLST